MPAPKKTRLIVLLTAVLTLISGVAHASLVGPDVAKYQHLSGSINWSAVKSGGSSFAFVKATEGTTYTNAYFASDWAAMRSAGLIRGAYHFGRASASTADAAAQARYFVSVVGKLDQPSDLAPVLDIETDPGISNAQMVSWIASYVSTIRQLTGRDTIIYTYAPFWINSTGNSTAFANLPLWEARYSSSEPARIGGWSHWTWWQYTSSATVSGIAGSTDMSRFYGSLDQLRSLANLDPTGDTSTSAVTGPTSGGHAVHGDFHLVPSPNGAVAEGWAVDTYTSDPVWVAMTVDGRKLTPFRATRSTTLPSAYSSLGSGHGLSTFVPIPAGTHRVCLVVAYYGLHAEVTPSCHSYSQGAAPRGRITSAVRSGSNVHITGWVIDPQSSSALRVSSRGTNGVTYSAAAGLSNGSVISTYPRWGRYHGFSLWVRATSTATLCVTSSNIGAGSAASIGCVRR